MNNTESTERIIDVTEIKTAKELQEKLKKELDFPEFYGMNWDAFWDTITGLVELPEILIINGWDKMVLTLPKESEIMKDLFEKFNKDYPMCRCVVKYN